MKLLRILTAKSTCLALALIALVPVAHASEIKVHIPFAAQWGDQLLSPGDYKFNVTDSSPLARVSGNGTEATVIVKSVRYQEGSERSEHSFLKIVNVNGTPTIAALGSQTGGMTYQFSVRKPSAHKHVPVQTTPGA